MPAPRADARTRRPRAPSSAARVLLRLFADPERATHVVTFERSVAGGAVDGDRDATTPRPPTRSDDFSALGSRRARRSATARPSPSRTARASTSAERADRGRAAAARRRPSCTTARPAGDYADWGLHLWGDAVAPRQARADRVGPRRGPRRGVEDGWARLRDPARGRHEAGQLHHAPAGRRQRAGRRASRAATARSSRSTARRSGCARATRRSTRVSRDDAGRGSARGRRRRRAGGPCRRPRRRGRRPTRA